MHLVYESQDSVLLRSQFPQIELKSQWDPKLPPFLVECDKQIRSTEMKTILGKSKHFFLTKCLKNTDAS